jgi:hypothetical protein
MTPERQKKLLDVYGWTFDPRCECVHCDEYRNTQPEDPIAIVGLDFVDTPEGRLDVRPGSDALTTLKRLSERPSRVGTNACVEGEVTPRAVRPSDLHDKAEKDPARKIISESDRRKATPIFSGVMRYFPDALAAVARLSKAGNDKHNPGQPLHWSRDKSTDHGDCIARHQVTFEETDPETGEFHAAAVAWRALAQLQLLEEKKQKEAAEPKCGPQEPADTNPWRKWLPTFQVPPAGRVEYKLRQWPDRSYTDRAELLTWGECGAATITAWRPAWEDKRRAA